VLLLPCFIFDGSERLGEIDLTLCSSTIQFSDLLRLFANNAAPLKINLPITKIHQIKDKTNATFSFCGVQVSNQIKANFWTKTRFHVFS